MTGSRPGSPRRRPSLTARGIAHARARSSRSSAPTGDSEASRLLAEDLGRPLPLQTQRTFVAYVRARTRFFDEQLTAWLANAPCQVVILGAGYDDRALRFRTPGVRFIEVDHPATQSDKRERLDRLGLDASDVGFLAADFEDAGFESRVRGELDASLPTLFICESVLPYLRPESSQRLLSAVSSTPAGEVPVSLLADLPVRPTRWRGRFTFAAFRGLTALIGEPVRTVLTPADVQRFLDRCGWREVRRVTGDELGMPPGRAEWVLVIARPADGG